MTSHSLSNKISETLLKEEECVMSILAICGGLREESNTNKLVNKIAKASGVDYEIVELGKLEIKPCTGCSECMMNEGKCPIEDDMQGLYGKLLKADAIILGSPTYFMNISVLLSVLLTGVWLFTTGASALCMTLLCLLWGSVLLQGSSAWL
jgi:putative NADPH-quinone reductase